MKISIITLFPDMVRSFFSDSIMKRAIDKGLLDISLVNLRDYAIDAHGSVDDRPYGGGAGMVIRPDVVVPAIKETVESTAKGSRVILTSAKGQRYSQKKAHEYTTLSHLVIIAGHYEGFDERVMDHVDEEISLGDYVMTGGEIAACAIADSVVRLVPGVLKKDEATAEESFFWIPVDTLIEVCGEDEHLGWLKKNHIQQVQLVEYPHYTRPQTFEGIEVPKVLQEGNHAEIRRWRIRQAYAQTKTKRPDLLDMRVNS